ncbi:MAG TPA: hypothetical protein VGR37_11415 [Longimicrobiaceae bacterium]|nr:hypothetical protein [Longimicrobiaceae bacterium]
MRHLALPALAVLALLAGCKDNPAQTPTEPPVEAAAAKAAQPEAAGESTLCAAYRRQLGAARASLARSPGDESLKGSVATYEAVISDACS